MKTAAANVWLFLSLPLGGKVREKQYPPAGGAGTQECNVLVYALTLAVCPSAAPVALD